MEDKNEKDIKGTNLSEENLDYLAKNDNSEEELNSTNKREETFLISKKGTEDNNKAEIENKEVPKAEIKKDLKTTEDNKAEIKSKILKTNSETNKIPIQKTNQTINDRLDLKPKVKPKKEIPIEKKPFNEFINQHLIPEIINEFKNRGKVVDVINIKKTNRPISEDICWVIYCEVQETCNFWLSFEKEDITSLKSFSLCKNYEKPSIIESFLIDEKKITLKLIISRILQRLNGQKLIGAN